MSPSYIQSYINFNEHKYSPDPLFDGQPPQPHQKAHESSGEAGTTEAKTEAAKQYLAGYKNYTESELQKKNQNLSERAAKEHNLSLKVRSAPHTRMTPIRLHYSTKRRLAVTRDHVQVNVENCEATLEEDRTSIFGWINEGKTIDGEPVGKGKNKVTFEELNQQVTSFREKCLEDAGFSECVRRCFAGSVMAPGVSPGMEKGQQIDSSAPHALHELRDGVGVDPTPEELEVPLDAIPDHAKARGARFDTRSAGEDGKGKNALPIGRFSL